MNLKLRAGPAMSESQDSFAGFALPEYVKGAATASYPLADIVLIKRHEHDVLGPAMWVVCVVGVVWLMNESFKSSTGLELLDEN